MYTWYTSLDQAVAPSGVYNLNKGILMMMMICIYIGTIFFFYFDFQLQTAIMKINVVYISFH